MPASSIKSTPHSRLSTPRIGGVAAQEALDAGERCIGIDEVERPCVTHPAAERRDARCLVSLRDEQERRRARAAIQIFVAAADREVGVARIQIDLQAHRRYG
jgi:hypothetical protein